MAHETLLADIAAAIDTLVEAADHEAVMMGSDMNVGKAETRLNEAREALDALILKHLRLAA